MRYSGYVKVLPKDKCLAISKIIMEERDLAESQLLCFLPDNIFGEIHKIDFINNSAIEVYGGWSIPFYFIEGIVEREE